MLEKAKSLKDKHREQDKKAKEVDAQIKNKLNVKK